MWQYFKLEIEDVTQRINCVKREERKSIRIRRRSKSGTIKKFFLESFYSVLHCTFSVSHSSSIITLILLEEFPYLFFIILLHPFFFKLSRVYTFILHHLESPLNFSLSTFSKGYKKERCINELLLIFPSILYLSYLRAAAGRIGKEGRVIFHFSWFRFTRDSKG